METSDDADLRALRELLRAEQEASGAGDVDALMALRTDDFVSVPPGAPAVEGKEAVREFLRQMFDSFRPTKAEFTFEDMRVSGDLAFARGTYRMTLTPSSGGDPISDTGNTLFIARRHADRSWKLVLAMWNANTTASEPE